MGISKQRRPDPDNLIVASINGASHRLTWAGGRIDAIVEELQVTARHRDDLLIRDAGTSIGFWLGRRSTEPSDLIAAALVLQAAQRADADQLYRWIETGRHRGEHWYSS